MNRFSRHRKLPENQNINIKTQLMSIIYVHVYMDVIKFTRFVQKYPYYQLHKTAFSGQWFKMTLSKRFMEKNNTSSKLLDCRYKNTKVCTKWIKRYYLRSIINSNNWNGVHMQIKEKIMINSRLYDFTLLRSKC